MFVASENVTKKGQMLPKPKVLKTKFYLSNNKHKFPHFF